MRSIRRNDLQFQSAMGNVPGPISRWPWCTTHGDFMLHIDAPCTPFSGTSPFARYRDIRSAVLLWSKQLEAGWTKEPPLTDTVLPMLALPARSAGQVGGPMPACRTGRHKHYECAVRRAPMDQGHARMRQARWRGTSRQRSSSKPVTLSVCCRRRFRLAMRPTKNKLLLQFYAISIRDF
jgi:hypothetical protein